MIGDSSDFLIMELRNKDRLMESIWFGRSPPKQIAHRLRGHITQYQLDNAQFELLLHSHELPSNLTDARRQLRAHVDEVMRLLPTVPSSSPAFAVGIPSAILAGGGLSANRSTLASLK